MSRNRYVESKIRRRARSPVLTISTVNGERIPASQGEGDAHRARVLVALLLRSLTSQGPRAAAVRMRVRGSPRGDLRAGGARGSATANKREARCPVRHDVSPFGGRGAWSRKCPYPQEQYRVYRLSTRQGLYDSIHIAETLGS